MNSNTSRFKAQDAEILTMSDRERRRRSSLSNIELRLNIHVVRTGRM